MIDFLFSIDYELYGDGNGSLEHQIYNPTIKLLKIFNKFNTKIIFFIETCELQKFEEEKVDPFIDKIKKQIFDLNEQGHEIALHLHPQWCKANFANGKWHLNYNEYHLCKLSKHRINCIVKKSILWLKYLIGDMNFMPISFRSGNWLLQPTYTVSRVLAGNGILIDSSVFKGGVQSLHKLDYRQSIQNGYYWKFMDNVNIPNPKGTLIEIPIYTKMVPFWKMATSKRIHIHKKSMALNRSLIQTFHSLKDKIRFWHPLKFDFCRMTINELKQIMEEILIEDYRTPLIYKPIVAIGHTKDLYDYETINLFLEYLKEKNISISTFKDVYKKFRTVNIN